MSVLGIVTVGMVIFLLLVGWVLELVPDPPHQRNQAAPDDRQADGELDGQEDAGAGGQREGGYGQGVHQQGGSDDSGGHRGYPACLRVADPFGDLGVAASRELQDHEEQRPAHRHGDQAGQPGQPGPDVLPDFEHQLIAAGGYHQKQADPEAHDGEGTDRIQAAVPQQNAGGADGGTGRANGESGDVTVHVRAEQHVGQHRCGQIDHQPDQQRRHRTVAGPRHDVIFLVARSTSAPSSSMHVSKSNSGSTACRLATPSTRLRMAHAIVRVSKSAKSPSACPRCRISCSGLTAVSIPPGPPAKRREPSAPRTLKKISLTASMSLRWSRMNSRFDRRYVLSTACAERCVLIRGSMYRAPSAYTDLTTCSSSSSLPAKW